mmetsp:Transcript_3836/g.9847  ORF Transcript_3836/g.9847 Transcript_3836/m.9847 type:complete len:435 (-) Transcript_3836:264-1568(-)
MAAGINDGDPQTLRSHLEEVWQAFGSGAAADLASLGDSRGNATSCLICKVYEAMAAASDIKELSGSKVDAESAEALAWEEKQTLGWKHPSWREAYVFSQLVKAALCIACDPPDAVAAMLALDMALIMGAPGRLVQPILEVVEPAARKTNNGTEGDPALTDDGRAELDGRYMPSASSAQPASSVDICSSNPIPRIAVESVTSKKFRKLHWKAEMPVIITGAMKCWSAMEKWPDLSWWKSKFGHRNIPLEVGLHGDPDWREEVTTIGSFIERHLRPSNLNDVGGFSVAYLAQHTLLDQFCDLQLDVEPPELCGECSPDGVAMVNVWMGTSGTKTPLHFDSYDNFLCQVAGYKYVRLYAQRESRRLYVDKESSSSTCKQHNISKVDPENPDFELYPLFNDAEYLDAVLGPGDMLFIPSKCWHYVRSLSTSISVNFWF